MISPQPLQAVNLGLHSLGSKTGRAMSAPKRRDAVTHRHASIGGFKDCALVTERFVIWVLLGTLIAGCLAVLQHFIAAIAWAAAPATRRRRTADDRHHGAADPAAADADCRERAAECRESPPHDQ
jgi:hypothetical protein